MYPPADGLQRFDISTGSTSVVAIIICYASFQLTRRARCNSGNDFVDVEVLDLVVDVNSIWVKKSWVVEGWKDGFAEKFFASEAIFIWTI